LEPLFTFTLRNNSIVRFYLTAFVIFTKKLSNE